MHPGVTELLAGGARIISCPAAVRMATVSFTWCGCVGRCVTASWLGFWILLLMAPLLATDVAAAVHTLCVWLLPFLLLLIPLFFHHPMPHARFTDSGRRLYAVYKTQITKRRVPNYRAELLGCGAYRS